MQAYKATIKQNITSWPELGINYWGINKNATSTLITHFSFLLNKLGENYDFEYSQCAKTTAKHENRYITREQAYNSDLLNFGVVRNPHHRLISCYNQFKSPDIEIHRRSATKAKFNPDWSMDDFMEYIEEIFIRNSEKANKHYQKQTWFIPSTTKMDYIIKLENLEQDWPFNFYFPKFKSNVNSSNKNVIYNSNTLESLYNEDFKNYGY